MGDPHFKPKNVLDVEKVMSETIRLCKYYAPDFIVILGDVLHTHELVYTQAYKRACLWIETLSQIAHTYVLIGNHDYINQTQFLTDEHVFGPLKLWPNVTIVDQVVIHSYHGVSFGFLPYVEPGRFLDALNTVGSSWQSCHTLFAHQEFKGAQMGSIVSVNGDAWQIDWPNVITGHIHETQYVDPHIYYPGSLMQHAAEDHTFKSIWYVAFYPEGHFDYDALVLQGIKPRKTITMTIQEIYSWDYLPELEHLHLKVKLVGTDEEKKVLVKSELYSQLKKVMDVKLPRSTLKQVHDRTKPYQQPNVTFRKILSDLIATKNESVQEAYAWLVSQSILQ